MGFGPPVGVKMGLSFGCRRLERVRQSSVYTLDKLKPFLSLIRNGRFEPVWSLYLTEWEGRST